VGPLPVLRVWSLDWFLCIASSLFMSVPEMEHAAPVVAAILSLEAASAPGGPELCAAAAACAARAPAAALAHARAAFAAAWAALHCAPRPASARPVLALAACLEGALALRAPAQPPEQLAAALRALDCALVVGGPPHAGGEGSLAGALAAAVEAALPPLSPPPDGAAVAAAAAADAAAAAAAAAARAAADAGALREARFAGAAPPRAPPAASRPSLAAFRALAAAGPALLRGCAAHWPALRAPAAGEADRRWAGLGRLRALAGRRTVPVELCDEGYMGGGFAVEMAPLAAFLDALAAGGGGGGSGGPLRYLAQHDLFSQVPALRRDVAVLDFACEGGGGGEPLLQAWLGPAGTVSNLHWDRARNLLAQVVGAKRFRLFPPHAAAALHAAPPPLENTSLLPLAALREPAPGGGGGGGGEWAAAFPRYARGEAGAPVEGVLLPGDVLYIPPGWWHTLEALTVSCSVSCWW
jgi:hypothetical protein